MLPDPVPDASSWSSEPIAVSPDGAARLAGLSRTRVYEALRDGSLASMKVGRRRLIRLEAMRAWLTALELARTQG
jgi:excisionase family DNA binding protein